MWRHSTLIPVPKKGPTEVLNYMRPVALTSLVMKALERIVKSHITKSVNPRMDLLQFVYRTGRVVDTAKLFVLAIIWCPETPNSLGT